MASTGDPKLKRTLGMHDILRISVGVLGLFCCYRLAVDSASYGVSRLFSTVAIVQSRLEATDTAVRFSPNDPEAHYTRALTLVNLGRLPEAVSELKQAIQLRPHHYYQWLDLGVTLDRLGDQTQAESALRESVRLAPNFAQPHWQLGNLLFRQGRYQEAFDELRLGIRSNPNLVEGMLALAWVAADGDVGRFEALVQPQGGRSHFEVARFLASQQKGGDAARHVRAAGQPRDDGERNLLHQTIAELISLWSFSDAFDIWAINHPSSSAGKGQILNGDFVDTILTGDPGFGWQIANVPNVSISIDLSGPNPNAKSLSIEFSGESSPASRVIHQLILTAPNSRYSLSFLAKTEKLVTGGPPLLVIEDMNSQSSKILGQSKPLSPGSGDWTIYTVDFSAEKTTSAILISLQRSPCTQNPCPVFGKLWLSHFTLSKA